MFFPRLFASIGAFIRRMVDPNVGTGPTDVYSAMFGCQFIIFLIILFSWSAFSGTEVSNIYCYFITIFRVANLILAITKIFCMSNGVELRDVIW